MHRILLFFLTGNWNLKMKTIKNKKGIILVVLVFVISLFYFHCTRENKVNVVLIVLDTLRADHLPFYGYKKNTAPFLSQLSSKSIVFENVFSASSYTSPSTASIFTSLYPFQHGVFMGFFASRQRKIKLNQIPLRIKTITEILEENGYKTFGIADNINICQEEGFTQGFHKFKRFPYVQEHKVVQTLKKWAEDIKTQEKYFLYIHFNDCHGPYHPRLPWYEKKENRREDAIARYDSEISYVDNKIKKLFHLFGWDENTLLIITADHGEEFWDHQKRGHGKSLYKEVIQVPLLIYFPVKDRIHKRIKLNVSNMDILPTVRNYLGIESNEIEEGLDLTPLIRGESKKHYKKRYIFAHLLYRDKNGPRVIFRAAVYKDWKYIFYENVSNRNIYRKELYNIAMDPRETHNRLGKNGQVAFQLFSRFMDFERKSRKFIQQTKNVSLTHQQEQELKTLGYVE
jgi:arylsulfatase A-like enzyme